MKITRRGSGRNNGDRSIVLDSPYASWENDGLAVYSGCVRDFGGGLLHDYTIKISSDDLIMLLSAISKKMPDEVAKNLGSMSRQVVAILAAIHGTDA